MIQLYHRIINHDLGRNFYEMTVSQKIKLIYKKIGLIRAQYNLHTLLRF